MKTKPILTQRNFERQVFDFVQSYISNGFPSDVLLAVDPVPCTPQLLPRQNAEKRSGFDFYELDELVAYGGGEEDAFEDVSVDGEITEPDEQAIARMARKYY